MEKSMDSIKCVYLFIQFHCFSSVFVEVSILCTDDSEVESFAVVSVLIVVALADTAVFFIEDSTFGKIFSL